jgi:hypothetical protein
LGLPEMRISARSLGEQLSVLRAQDSYTNKYW